MRIRNILIISIILLFIVVPSAYAQDAWFDTDWQNRIQINSTSAQVADSHSNKTRYINLSIIENSSFWSNVRSDGLDIVVTNKTGTPLSREIVNIDTTAETGEMHFRTLSENSASNTTYYIYYNNPSATLKNNFSAWESQYSLVWHLDEDPSGASPQFIDSTSNGNNGTASGMNISDRVAMKIYNGSKFDGDGDADNEINGGSGTSIDNIWDDGGAISWWMELDGNGQDPNARPMHKRDGGSGWELQNQGNNGTHISFFLIVDFDGSDGIWRLDNLFSENEPHHFVIVYNSSDPTNDPTIYVDGVANTVGSGITETSAPSGTRVSDAANDLVVGTQGATAHIDGEIDELKFYDTTMTANEVTTEYNNLNDNGAFWGVADNAESSPTAASGSIDILSPGNETLFQSNDINISFRARSSTFTVFDVNVTVNGTNIYTNSSYQNNSLIILSENLGGTGVQNLTVDANGTAESQFFTIKTFETVTRFNDPDVETNTTNFTISIRINRDLVQNTTSYLFSWNQSEELGFDFNRSNSTYDIFKTNFTIPIVETNNSQFDHFWIYNLTYSNGSTIGITTSTDNQNITFAYFLNGAAQSQNETNIIEGDAFQNNISMVNTSDTATVNVIMNFRGENFTARHVGSSIFSLPIDSGTIDTATETFDVTSWLNVSFNGKTRLDRSESDTITIQKIILDECGTRTNTTTLFMELKDEDTLASVTGDIEITANATSPPEDGQTTRTYNFTFLNTSSAEICLHPSFANYSLFSWIQYDSDDHSQRDYFVDQYISNTSTNISLFLLNDTASNNVIFFARDADNDPVTDHLIRVQRYIVGNNTFRTVAVCKTDNPTGKCVVPLRVEDTYYRQIVEVNRTVVLETTPRIIVFEPFESFNTAPPYPVVLRTESRTVPEYYTLIGTSISFSCNNDDVEDGTTETFTCTINDPSGTVVSSSLIVRYKGATQWTTICETSEIGATPTHTCDLSNGSTLTVNETTYAYQLKAQTTNANRIVDSDFIDFASALFAWGSNGLFIMMIVVMALFFIGALIHPSMALIFSFGGIVAGFMVGALPLVIESIIGLAVAIGIMVWRMK